MKNIRVHEIMTKDIVHLTIEDTVDKIATIFDVKKIHHIPVLSLEGNLVGIVSKTDFDRVSLGMSLFRDQYADEYNNAMYRTTRVVDIMTKDVISLSPNHTLQDAYEIFKENMIRALPVLENGMLKGIVTPIDLLEFLLNDVSELQN